MSSPSSAAPPPVGNAVGRAIVGDEEPQPFGDAARAHIGRVEAAHVAQPVAELLFGLAADAGFRVVRVEQSGASLDQRLGMAGRIGRDSGTGLHQQHGATLAVVGQDHRAVAAIVGLADLRLPDAVVAPVVEHRLLQHGPFVGKHFNGADADAVVQAGSPVIARRFTIAPASARRSPGGTEIGTGAFSTITRHSRRRHRWRRRRPRRPGRGPARKRRWPSAARTARPRRRRKPALASAARRPSVAHRREISRFEGRGKAGCASRHSAKR